ncbi:hypothetical protein [Lactiplantibacillus plantarum]|uniref:hypothetical protein n=1 Tax=Lactiplantibacillus plantarum TaxID=1590 RepID=UPI0020006293|nr:hypothetical protein [Lactiplantibacillus plantarum]
MTRDEFIQAVAAANPEPLKSNLMQARIVSLKEGEVEKLKAEYLAKLGYSDPDLEGKQFNWSKVAETNVPNKVWAERFCDAIPENAEKTVFSDEDVQKATSFHHRLEVFTSFPEDVQVSVQPETTGWQTAKQQAASIKASLAKRVSENLDAGYFTSSLIESGEQFIEQKQQYLRDNGLPISIKFRQLKWLVRVTPLITSNLIADYFYKKYVAPTVTKRLLDDSAIEAILANVTLASITDFLIQLFKKNPQSFKVQVKSDIDPADLKESEDSQEQAE